jgi:hypothetical protein
MEKNMNHTGVKCRPSNGSLNFRRFVAFLTICIVPSIAMLAEDLGQPKNSPWNVPATHLMGFEGVPRNANGTLSIEPDAVRFQESGNPAVEVKIATIQDVLLGNQTKQVGGLPMTLTKAAVPFGGGRAVSFFAHKKYDSLTLEYVDTDGGLHGAIFELKKGQGEVFRNELVARGARVNDAENAPVKKTTEVSNEKE